MLTAKLKLNFPRTIALALLLSSAFASQLSSAEPILKHYDNPVVCKIQCPKDYSIGTLHVVSANMASGHELDNTKHFRIATRGEGFHYLMSLKILEPLSLEGTSVTIGGIKSLAPLKLKFLNIPNGWRNHLLN